MLGIIIRIRIIIYSNNGISIYKELPNVYIGMIHLLMSLPICFPPQSENLYGFLTFLCLQDAYLVGSNWVSFLKTPHISTHVKSKSELAGRCKRSSTPAARKTRNERAMKTYENEAISSYHIHLMIQKLANRDCQYGDGSKPCTPGEHQNNW